jgi:uncharacterized caspase-like protein/GTPase SAR1 family protein
MANNQAIVIGVNNYRFLPPLNYAKRDAEVIRDFLIEEARFDRVFFFSDDSPHVNGMSTEPFRANVLRVLRKVFELPFMSIGDNFWFFFSGHGIRCNDRDYIMPLDGDPEDVEGTGIATNYITERLRRCGAENTILILDACRGMGQRSGEGIGRQTLQDSKNTGIISIFSCSPNEYSYEVDEIEQGIFTYAFLMTLRAPTENMTVDILNVKLKEQVFNLGQQYKRPRQTPYIIAEPITKYIINLQKEVNNSFKEDESEKEYNGLIELVEKLTDILSEIKVIESQNQLDAVKHRLLSDQFRILVLGEFKRGKTTLVNAFLGREILPMSTLPCTGIPTEIKWGETPKALLHFKKVTSANADPPWEIPIVRIEDYVVIRDHFLKKNDKESSYEKLELFYPLESPWGPGIEIIDTPGLNDAESRTAIVDNYLSNVDAVIFVLSCEALGSQSELSFIRERLNIFSPKAVIFVCNRFNMIRSQEKDMIRLYAISRLASFTDYGAEGIFFVDAVKCLDGHLNGEEDEVECSGIPLLEREIKRLLIKNMKKIKIYHVLSMMKKIICELQQSNKISLTKFPNHQIPFKLAEIQQGVDYFSNLLK